MSRLLIITAWYHPFIHPRAHRWTALAEYWAAQGHEVHVVSARHPGFSGYGQIKGVQVHRAGFDSLKEVFYYRIGTGSARGRVGGSVKRPALWARLAGRLYKAIWKNLYFPDDACLWYFPARKKVMALLKEQSFDAMISVSLPFTGHLIGLVAKQRFPALHWLADTGDPFTMQARPLNNARLYGRLSRRLEQKVLEQADSVVVTHPAAATAYRSVFGAVAQKISVIPPLLHPAWEMNEPEAGPQNAAATPAERVVNIGYFGAFYAPVRTPDAFLDLLEKTFRLRPDWQGRLQVHIYGDIFPEFWDKLNRQPAIRLYGLRSRGEVRAAMRQMNVLLNIGNVTDYQLPSKAVEYFASGKPVVNLSNVQNDPFTDFWGDQPGLFTLRADHNEVSEGEVRRWIAFLEDERYTVPAAARLARVEAFTVEAIGAAYGRCLNIEC
ncbi:MAG: glycosyltransferase [Thermoanaerobaculia bacterium]|nr:glycosyltransferase [Thermoanaerobaculia bacterium]